MNYYFLVVSFLISISNIFVYKIESYEVLTTYTNDDNEVKQEWKTIYYNVLSWDYPILVYISLSVLIVGNYLFLLLLVVLNALIYVELRKLMVKKSSMVYKKRNKPKRDGEPTSSISDTRSKSEQSPSNNSNTKELDHLEKESLRKMLIMTLWVSLVFCSNRLVFGISLTVLLLFQNTVYQYYMSAFTYFWDMLVYSSYFFVYMNTNKSFKKTFYRIFLRRRI